MGTIRFITAGFLVLWAGLSTAETIEKTVEYKQGGTVLEGFIAYPADTSAKTPAVIVVHEWNGLGDYVKNRARQLAGLGYVAFAADIYGKGVRPSNPEDSKVQSSRFKNDRPLLRARAKAAFDHLKKDPRVDARRIAAIGYCFGGTTVLEMARSGLPLTGVVSFHGNLDTPLPAKKGSVKSRVLVLHGAEDAAVSDEQILAFQKEMRDAGVDWQFHAYSGAVHAFTNPANQAKTGNARYDAKADRRSWEAMKDFLEESFAGH